jgi:hypothetical protein
VKFETTSGFVQVTEVPAVGCKDDPAKLYVTVNIASTVLNQQTAEGKLFYNQTDNSISTAEIDLATLKSLLVYNALGQEIKQSYIVQGNKITLSNALIKGVYIIRLNASGKQFVIKILAF